MHRILLAATVAVGALLLLPASGSAESEAAGLPGPLALPADGASLTIGSWLEVPGSTMAGPVLLAPVVEPARDRVVEAWQSASPTPQARTAALRRIRLEYGLGDLRVPAQAVYAAAALHEGEPATELARELAPGMPALQWARVKDLSEARAFGAAAKAFGTLVWEVGHDLESQRWLLGNGLLLMWIVALASAALFILLLGIKAFPHAAHDLGDLLAGGMPAFGRFALLAGLLLAPLWLGEGLAGLVLALFAVAFLYGNARERGVLVMAAILCVVALHPLANWASIAATADDLDPIAPSVRAVVRGTASGADVERLEAAFAEDPAAAHAIAYRARRHGMDEVARERLDSLVERFPTDPVGLANRGTIEMRAGRTEAAIELFERAAARLESPTLLFDLSQAYANVLRIEESEAALARAQRIADPEVAALSSLSDPRLAADLAFPVETLRHRSQPPRMQAPSLLIPHALAPGRLGEGLGTAASGFAIAAFVGVLWASRFDRSSACTRCGRRICTRCESTVWSDDLCEDCHHLFRNPDATDPKLRMARLATLSRREAWVNRMLDLGSILVPGVAGLSLRRPDLALFGIALFAWGLAWIRWPAGILVDAMWLGALAPMGLAVLGSLALLAYAGIVVGSVVARRNR